MVLESSPWSDDCYNDEAISDFDKLDLFTYVRKI
jgi:hypothetical protein